jgi:hypothetical protein
MDDDVIRVKVRQKLQSGALPRTTWPLEQTETAHQLPPDPVIRQEMGSGQPCVACDEPITAAERLIRYPYPPAREVCFHERCEAIWQEERLAV